MSRSHRKHPFTGITTCASERDDKQRSHRAWRHAVRRRLDADLLSDDAKPLPHWHEYSDPWSWGKDGHLRFDPKRPYAAQLWRK